MNLFNMNLFNMNLFNMNLFNMNLFSMNYFILCPVSLIIYCSAIYVRVVIDKCARRNRQVFSLSLRDIIYLPISEQNWLR